MTSLETAEKIFSIVGAVAGVAGAILTGIALRRMRASEPPATGPGRAPRVRQYILAGGLALLVVSGGALYWGLTQVGPRHFELVAYREPFTVPLDTSQIPQRSFDHRTLEGTSEDDRGFTIECRMPPDQDDPQQNRSGCRPGTVPAYHLDPSPETGTTVALSDASGVDDPDTCHDVAAGATWVPVEQDDIWCVLTAKRLVMIRMVELPDAVPAGIKSVRIELSAWKAKD